MTASMLRSLPLPPGALGYPIIGATGDWARDPLLFGQDRHARYGPVWQTHLFSSRGWSKTNASLMRTVRFELLPDQDFSPVATPTPMQKDGLQVRVNSA